MESECQPKQEALKQAETDLKGRLAKVSSASAGNLHKRALSVFDFSQKAGEMYRGSKSGGSTRDPVRGDFEPYSRRRKSLPRKETALRLYG